VKRGYERIELRYRASRFRNSPSMYVDLILHSDSFVVLSRSQSMSIHGRCIFIREWDIIKEGW
jgi:hypothetical protein